MLTRAQLLPLLQQANEEMLAEERPAKELMIRITSGTSAAGPLMRIFPVPQIARFGSSQRVLVLGGTRTLRLANALFQKSDGDEASATVLALDISDLAILERIIAEFSPDRVVGLPSFVQRVFVGVEDSPSQKVEQLLLFGERLSSGMREEFEKRFPRALIRIEYINAEMGRIGGFCPHLPLNHYHTLPKTPFMIYEPNSEGVGEIVVSQQLARSVYAEEYRTGDAGRIVKIDCPCGAEETFEMLGRIGYDYVRAGGAQLRIEEFERVAKDLDLYLQDFRAEVGQKEGKWFIRLRVYPRGTLLHDATTLELFRSQFEKKLFVTASRTLAELVREEDFFPLEVECANESFPLGNKTVKLRRLLD
jgi:phenylacetate-coenzyme A ligase PaaK-like adenylate-forming protein